MGNVFSIHIQATFYVAKKKFTYRKIRQYMLPITSLDKLSEIAHSSVIFAENNFDDPLFH